MKHVFSCCTAAYYWSAWGVAVAGLLNHMPLGRELSLSGLRSWHRFKVGSGTVWLCDI